MIERHSLPAAQRLIVALDVPTISRGYALIDQLKPVVRTYKVGYWLLFNPNFYLLARACRRHDSKLFLDAKLNDIPATVRQGVSAAARLGAAFITVHSDATMLAAAMEGKGSSAIKVMAVTALTSLSAGAACDRFRAGVVNAVAAGCDGLIMSPADLKDAMGVRAYVGAMLIATPGVRMAGSLTNDHARTGTPAEAIGAGADYIIIGRPIIHADDPLAAANQIVTDLSEPQLAGQ